MLHVLLGDVAADVLGSRASAAMAVQNLMLAAHAVGLGSCCLTGPLVARDELGELLRLGRSREIAYLIALGYPEVCPPAPARRSTVSIGVAHFPAHGDTPELLVERSRAAMEHARAAGGARVATFAYRRSSM